MLLFLAAMCLTVPRLAAAGGSGAYPNGAEAFLVGMMPPPGFYAINYLNFYHADEMKDDDGDAIGAFDKSQVLAEVLRLVWISDQTVFGATWGQHLFIPWLAVDLDFNTAVGPRHKRSYSDRGVPYLIYSPCLLGWHLREGKLHVIVSLVDTYIPVGGEEDDNLAAVGRDFWTFEPLLALTWLHGQWEFSTKILYDFSTRQDDFPTIYGFAVDRTPGQELHGDFSVSRMVAAGLRLGVSGYAYTQTTDDDYHPGAEVPEPVRALLATDAGNRSRVFAAGPGLWYNWRNFFFELRSQFEFAARNKTEGSSHWFKVTGAF
jgi:hypothetical protein